MAKIVLSSLPNYYMSILKIPSIMCKALEPIRASFFLEREQLSGIGLHLVGWKYMYVEVRRREEWVWSHRHH